MNVLNEPILILCLFRNAVVNSQTVGFLLEAKRRSLSASVARKEG